MKSQYADKFNHDQEAAGYDRDVRNEAHPIRAGYSDLLEWVAKQTAAAGPGPVLELGSGTGNLTGRLPQEMVVTCVDVSQEMMQIAQGKLAPERPVTYIQDDMLAFFNRPRGPFTAVASTYTIHHLTEEEKGLLFKAITGVLGPGGAAVFGDLMFENKEAEAAYIAMCRENDQDELASVIDDEFFWNLETAVNELQKLGFQVETKQFSDLSWGIVARKLVQS